MLARRRFVSYPPQMRSPRKFQLGEGCRYFHCISRVVNRDFVFGNEEREYFRQLLRKVEAFSGVRVLTWTILSNHFHLLVYVPDREKLTEKELLDRVGKLYDRQHVRELEGQLEQWRDPLFDEPRNALCERYFCRMYDLSEFMKTLKQRFTMWFNRGHGRKGTLWEERFKSVAVGGSWNAMLTVAAYIDLNSVRAGLVADPKDYRWCGYAEAVNGEKAARTGIALAFEEDGPPLDWGHVGTVYRKLLFGKRGRHDTQAGITPQSVEETLKNGGKLSIPALLRCRIRYFTDGAVIGTLGFVNRFFESRRTSFGPNRKSGARKMKGADWGDLRTLRDLQRDVIRIS